MDFNFLIYHFLYRRRWTRRLLVYWRLRRLHKRDSFAFQASALTCLVPFLLPFVASGYQLFQLASACTYAIALMGLNLLTGLNGQLSIGHGAFFGLGAFSLAILMARLKIHYLLALGLSSAISFAVGIVFGIPALRLERLSLALATFSLAVCFPQILMHFDSLTGGNSGLSVDRPNPPPFLARLGVSQDLWLYIVCATVVALVLYLLGNLVRSKTGRAFRAIRDHEIASEAAGINNALYRILCFGISTAITGAGGALSALIVGRVAPDSFGESLSILFLSSLVVGGLGSIQGPLYGALFMQYVPRFTESISPALTSAVYGLVLIVFVFFGESGIAGLLNAGRVYARNLFSYFKF